MIELPKPTTVDTQIGATIYTVRREFTPSASTDCFHVLKKLILQAARDESAEKLSVKYQSPLDVPSESEVI